MERSLLSRSFPVSLDTGTTTREEKKRDNQTGRCHGSEEEILPYARHFITIPSESWQLRDSTWNTNSIKSNIAVTKDRMSSGGRGGGTKE